jgi:hypothetical protein
MNRFAAYADNGGVPFEKSTPAKPRKPKPKSRFANDYDGVDEEGYIPNMKRETMSDTDNPFYKMIDRQALALQQQTGESYASCFTKCYTAPENKMIVDQVRYEHLAQGHDAMFGYRLATPVTKAAPPDAVQDDVDPSARGDNPGPAHRELHGLIDRRMKADSSLSYERAFGNIYIQITDVSRIVWIKNPSCTRGGLSRRSHSRATRRRGIGE